MAAGVLGFLRNRRYRQAVDHAAEDLFGAFGPLAPDEARRAARRAADARERAFCEAVAARLSYRLGGSPEPSG